MISADLFLGIRQRRLEIAFVISILLHLLFALFFSSLKNYWFGLGRLHQEPYTEPLVFEFERPREVVENPNADRAPVENAPFASDQSSRARDLSRDNLPDSPLPYSEGVFPTREIPRPEASQPAQQSETLEKVEALLQARKERLDHFAFVRQPQKFSREVMGAGGADYIIDPPKVPMDNRAAGAKDFGGLSINTYAWDFAPYMLYLKKRIERNIYPPPAFTIYGSIEGNSLIEFHIDRSGKLTDVKVLNAKGHNSLTETSKRAIMYSAPFRSLPEDFPEEKLIVTGNFVYFVYPYNN